MVSEFRNKFRYFLEIRVNSIHSRVMASHGNSSSANDPRQPSTARPFAIMGLVTKYMGLARPGMKG
ncbi:hypothetical protein HS088_TW15G00168 [Tripterygium wilfordii]|uniref:Uncharacterized protein n=1 Tax=Tripterygium wilfordii TaxID=458696 RepID=A0A7J7CL30_TRIWF|nr:hypothetical protein HS088_TW15G00168 [Tripterygium wilfordii]